MSFFAFLVFVVLILAAAWFYQWLKRVEAEIRAELGEKGEAATVVAGRDPAPSGNTESSSPSGKQENPDGLSAEDRILEVVRSRPGIRQAEVYGLVADISKRRVQDILRRLEQEGRLRRIPDRGSYRLETV